MRKRNIFTYIITGLLSIFVFFLILYFFGFRIDTSNDKYNTVKAQSQININEEEVELSPYEKEGIEIYNNSVKSVVNISTTTLRYDFFLNVYPTGGIGSGSIITKSGHVLTNYHVIKDVYESQKGSSITITTSNKNKYEAEIVGVDPTTDLAVLKIKSNKKFIPLAITKSENIRVGQRVYAIGNPFGLSETLTQGIISSLGRTITATDGTLIEEVIQTDAAINPGNSGGPLLDSKGRMIGVNTSIFTKSDGSIGIGFAISSDIVIKVVEDILKFGLVKRPTLGIENYSFPLSTYPKKVYEYLGFPVSYGISFYKVLKGSPADKFGLRPFTQVVVVSGFFDRYEVPEDGDVIIEIDGKKVTAYSDIKNIIKYKNFGDEIELKIVRDKKIITLKIELFDW